MGTFLSYFLVCWGIMTILYKYNVSERIKKLSDKTRIRFFYELSECEFCIEHHASIIPAVFVGVFFGFEWELLAYPIMSASMMNIVKTIRQK